MNDEATWYAALAATPCAWDRIRQFADWLEGQGRPLDAMTYRWAAEHQRWPVQIFYPPYSWLWFPELRPSFELHGVIYQSGPACLPKDLYDALGDPPIPRGCPPIHDAKQYNTHRGAMAALRGALVKVMSGELKS